MTVNECFSRFPDLDIGMAARSPQGERLGKITSLDDDGIHIERGWFFPKEFSVRYSDIVTIQNGEVVLNQSRSELERWRSDPYTSWQDYNRLSAEEEEEQDESEREAAADGEPDQESMALREVEDLWDLPRHDYGHGMKKAMP
jgi:hypothetical protein